MIVGSNAPFRAAHKIVGVDRLNQRVQLLTTDLLTTGLLTTGLLTTGTFEHLDRALTDGLAATVESAGLAPYRMHSGAGQDAVVMAGLCPAAMLFLRSPGGISHHPDEAVRREDVRAALDVMVRFLAAELDRE